MLEKLKQEVYEANMQLARKNLVSFTWGNASGIDRTLGLVVIKPSGVNYEDLSSDKLVVIDMNGRKVDGDLNPSSDTKTHLELYKAFKEIGGIAHAHSPFAVAWAQAGEDVPCYGATHADYFYGPVPCARSLLKKEVDEDYEKNTGRTIVETFNARNIEPMYLPAVLCRSHGPFTWGTDASQAVYHAAVLEEVCKMAMFTRLVSGAGFAATPQYLQDKHFSRQHGPYAYYGQAKE